MFIRVKLVPRRLRTAARFRAEDPWNGGVASDFTVEVYRFVPEHARVAPGLYTWGTPERFGIRSDVDGVERMLPEALVRLWQARRVPAEQLPLLLHELEPSLSPRDYRPVPRAGRIALVAWLITLLAAAGYVAVRPSAEAALQGAAPRSVTREEWARTPPRAGETVVVHGLVPVSGMVELPAPPHVPEGVSPAPLTPGAARRAASVGWVPDARGHRLVLISPGNYMTRGTLEIGWAAVLTPAALGLDARLLADLRQRVPDLDSASITCPGWQVRRRAGNALVVRAGLILLLVVSFGCALGFTLAWPIAVWRRRHVQAQMEWALQRLGGVLG